MSHAVCTNNSGIGYMNDGSETPMSTLLTLHMVYTGDIEDGEFLTIDDMGEPAVFDAERFQLVD